MSDMRTLNARQLVNVQLTFNSRGNRSQYDAGGFGKSGYCKREALSVCCMMRVVSEMAWRRFTYIGRKSRDTHMVEG